MSKSTSNILPNMEILTQGLEKSLQGSSDKVVLFCLTHMAAILLKDGEEHNYVKLYAPHDLCLRGNDYPAAADLLRPFGFKLARIVWTSGFGKEPDPMAHIVYRGEIESILKYEYYRDHPDYFYPKLDHAY